MRSAFSMIVMVLRSVIPLQYGGSGRFQPWAPHQSSLRKITEWLPFAARHARTKLSNARRSAMDQDDLPPPKRDNDPADEQTFAGALGLTFAGFAWVAIFAVLAGLMLWGVIRWLG